MVPSGQLLADANTGSSHIEYDSVTSRFISLTENGTAFNASSDGQTWAFTGEGISSDSAYAFLSAKTALAAVGGAMYKSLEFDDSAPSNKYRSGAAVSDDGVSWAVEATGMGEAAHTVPESQDEVYFKEISSIKYVLVTASNSGAEVFNIYTSTDKATWVHNIEFETTLNNSNGQLNNIDDDMMLDVEFDGVDYLLMFNDLYFTELNATPKGTMIIKTNGVDTIELLETGIKSAAHNLTIEADDSYTLVGAGGLIATQAH